MVYDEAVAAVIRERLAVMRAIDDSAELSFMESAGFRLELFSLVQRLDNGVSSTAETMAALNGLHQRVTDAISPIG